MASSAERTGRAHLIFIGVLLAVLGPRIGFIDYITLGVVYLAGLALLLRPVRLSRDAATLIGLHVLYTVYVLVIYFFTAQSDGFLLARTGRMLLSTVLLTTAFSAFQLSPIKVANMLLIALLLHAVMVFVEIAHPPLRDVIARAYGFATYFVRFRAVGLSGGYDGASLLCIFGLIIALLRLLRTPGAASQALLAIAVFSGATFFTGRTGMTASVVLVGLVAIRSALRSRGGARAASWLLIGAAVVAALVVVRVVLVQTLPMVRPWLGEPEMATENFALRGQYAAATGNVWLEMWALPESWAVVLFGEGAAPGTIDVGFIRMIHFTGVFGLLLVGLIYGFMYSRARAWAATYRSRRTPEGQRLTVVAASLAGCILAMTLYNAKALFFLSRSTHEFLIILFAALAAHRAREAAISPARAA